MIISDEQQIDASQAIVWKITEDINKWAQWTPTVEKAIRLDDGPFDVGSSARIKQPVLPETVWRVTALNRSDGFTWESRVRGIRMVATHKLSPCASGTKSVLLLEVPGIVGVLLWPLISGSIRRAIKLENSSLKAVCEAYAQST